MAEPPGSDFVLLGVKDLPGALGQRAVNDATSAGVASPSPVDVPMAAMAGDAVTSLLQKIRINTWVSGLSSAAGRWTFSPPSGASGFHAVIEGTMVIRGADGIVHHLRGGDLALVLGGEHVVGDHPESPLVHLHQVMTREDIKRHRGLTIGTGEPHVRMIGGFIGFEGPAGSQLRTALPQIVIIRGSIQASDALVPTVIRLLEAQSRDSTPGTNAVMTQLVTLLFQEAVRHELVASGPSRSGWAKAVLDDHIGPVLGLIHSSPGKSWTLAEMANEAGLSRTVFHERFSALVGMPPAAYLREHRLEVGADLLRNSETAVRVIARRAGYASQGAFCSAFKRWAGKTPVEYRQEHAHAAPGDDQAGAH